MRTFKLSKSQMLEYLANKKKVNEWLDQVMDKIIPILDKNKIEWFGASTIYLDNGKQSFSTYYIGKDQQRISSHKKKNTYYNMDHGLLFTMRNVKKSDIDGDVKKVLNYLGVKNDKKNTISK